MSFSQAYLDLYEVTEDLLKEASIHRHAFFGMSPKEEKQIKKLVKKHAPKASVDEVMEGRSLLTKGKEALFGHNPDKALHRHLGKENKSLGKENKRLKRIAGPTSFMDDPVTNAALGVAAGSAATLAYNSHKTKNKK
jgi:hypothetical protein